MQIEVAELLPYHILWCQLPPMPINPQHSIQIILPAYNDREALAARLPELREQGWAPEELMVVDAGGDGSEELARAHGVPVFRPPAGTRGRAKQMNLGAAQSRADLLLFLHADTRLPDTTRRQLERAVEGGAVGGAFSRRFDSPSRLLRATCALADLRGRLFGWFLGDQAIWAKRGTFEDVGGFPEREIFEDLEFCRRLRRHGETVLLSPGVVSSARRFDRDGSLRRTWKDILLTLKYLRGDFSG